MPTSTNLRIHQGAATRSALVQAARRIFAERGYHEAATEDLAACAGVTRGALYHHFRDKEALFEAVFRELAVELQQKAIRASEPLESDLYKRLQEGVGAYLRVIAGSYEMQRVLLLDGPSVLGWTRWREVMSQFTLGAMIDAISRLRSAGAIRTPSASVAAQLLLAALHEAALLIAHSNEPETTAQLAGEALRAMLEGLH